MRFLSCNSLPLLFQPLALTFSFSSAPCCVPVQPIRLSVMLLCSAVQPRAVIYNLFVKSASGELEYCAASCARMS